MTEQEFGYAVALLEKEQQLKQVVRPATGGEIIAVTVFLTGFVLLGMIIQWSIMHEDIEKYKARIRKEVEKEFDDRYKGYLSQVTDMGKRVDALASGIAQMSRKAS